MVQQENSELKRLNIAIDGYSGCGKSTLARDLAAELDYVFIDTGAMYRGLTHYFQINDISDVESDGVAMLERQKPQLSFESGSNHLILNGEDIETIIRNDSSIASKVSDVAAIPAVRSYLKSLQEAYIAQKGVVMEGRDIGTVIMPDADIKLFITASLAERVDRRYEQLTQSGVTTSKSEVEKNLQDRDRKDASRETAPLRKAEDAVVLDTTRFNQSQQLEVALAMVRPYQSPESFLPFIR